MTRKLLSLMTAAAVFAACAPADVADQYREALPKKEAIQIGTPDGGVDAGALSFRRDALGETPYPGSEYAVMSYWTAVTFNLGVWWTLNLVQFIVAHPPTACDDLSCTWGPWADDKGNNFWQMVVTKEGEAYAYVLSARNAETGGPFMPLLSGTALPGADRDHGSGSFTIDFDVQADLHHYNPWEQTDFGTLSVVYDNTSILDIGATFLGAKNSEPGKEHFLNAAYSFQASSAGGELQIGFLNLSTTENVALRTRWNAAGAGRADARYNDPRVPVTYEASECWADQAGSFLEVYDTKWQLGSEDYCAFRPASYADIAIPMP